MVNNYQLHYKDVRVKGTVMLDLLYSYKTTVKFLGSVLGPDYEVVLQDLSNKNHSVIAIENGHISGRTIGSPLTSAVFQMLSSKVYEENEAERIYFNLKERIQSVKREEVRDELTDFLSKLFGKKVFRELEKEEEKSDLKISVVKSLIQDNKGNVYKEYTDLCDWYGEETARNLAYELWHYCLQEQLVLQKYLMKEKEMTEV